MAIADEHWNQFKQQHEEFKLSWKQETSAFKEKYKNEIIRLQGGGEHDADVVPQDIQQLEFTSKQLEKAQDNNNQLQQQLLTQNDTMSKFQTLVGSLMTKLTDTTKEVSVNNNKYLKEKDKVDLVKIKLDDFINTHKNIDDQDQLLEILGALQQEEA